MVILHLIGTPDDPRIKVERELSLADLTKDEVEEMVRNLQTCIVSAHDSTDPR